jgi:hypothetical protein
MRGLHIFGGESRCSVHLNLERVQGIVPGRLSGNDEMTKDFYEFIDTSPSARSEVWGSLQNGGSLQSQFLAFHFKFELEVQPQMS